MSSLCPPAPQDPCQQTCAPPPPAPPCRVKPVMRGLHLAQTKFLLLSGLGLAAAGGTLTYVLVNLPRQRAYAEYYRKTEFDDLAEEMARKGLFQAVPPESLKDTFEKK